MLLGARDAKVGTAATADELGARSVQIDVTNDGSVAAAAADVERYEGAIDVLINNVGVPGTYGDPTGLINADMQSLLDVNLFLIDRDGKITWSWRLAASPFHCVACDQRPVTGRTPEPTQDWTLDEPEKIDTLRRQFEPLFARTVNVAVDLDSPQRLSKLTEQIRRALDASGATVTEVRAGETLLGVVTREQLDRATGDAGGAEPVPVGSGDHALLAGESSQYRVIRYACACGGEAFRVSHDTRALPACPACKSRLEKPSWT